MQLFGYSERGALNALFNEIAYSGSPDALLSSMLGSARFPMRHDESTSVVKSHILVEQSLSDFGDADAIMLLETRGTPRAVFLEAKVKPTQTAAWTIEQEFQKFLDGTASQVSSSNLFTQLYHKVRFVEGLRRGGIELLQRGIPFPPSSTRATRKIGRNGVVLRAVALILPYIEDVRYLAVVPDSPDHVSAFFTSGLSSAPPPGYQGWDVRNYGYLCWSDIDRFCHAHGLTNTCRVFEFNKGQIY